MSHTFLYLIKASLVSCSAQLCKAKPHTNSSIQMRTSLCVCTTRKMFSPSCASAMKCSIRDCICWISLLVQLVCVDSRTQKNTSDWSIISYISVLGISLFKVLTIVAFPVAIAKSGISLLHAYVAAQNLAIIDLSEREAIREKNAAKKPE